MIPIIEHPSPNHSERNGTPISVILLHHTATRGDASALRTLCDPDPRDEHGNRLSRVSAHYLVGVEGTIYRLVPESLEAWHAGVSCLPWEMPAPHGSVNPRSIGIEIVNPGDGKTPFTEAQYTALACLVPDIVRRLNPDRVRVVPLSDFIPMAAGGKAFTSTYILGHRDVAPGRKTDPADNFDWARIREALAPAPRVG